jgi:hypothetical protein
VNRRLRLALFLAALAAAGPMPSARVLDAARADVSTAWFRSDRIASLRSKHSLTAMPNSGVAGIGFQAHRDPVVPNARLTHSLFQRPPPLQR